MSETTEFITEYNIDLHSVVVRFEVHYDLDESGEKVNSYDLTDIKAVWRNVTTGSRQGKFPADPDQLDLHAIKADTDKYLSDPDNYALFEAALIEHANEVSNPQTPEEITRLRRLICAARHLILASTGSEDGPTSWQTTRDDWLELTEDVTLS